jgi:hypothetical protein
MSTVNTNKLKCTNISHSSGAIALTFDSANRVRRPNLPVFYGWRDIGSESWENFGTTPVVYNYNLAQVNRGNHYNTGTGVFTCPLAGVYLIHCGYLGGNTASYSYMYVYKNGINQTANSIHHNVGNYWKVNSQVFAFNCSVNDQLAMRVVTGNATIYGKEHAHCSIWFQG